MSHEQFIEREREQLKTLHEAGTLEERMATPEGQALIAEMRAVMGHASTIVQQNEEAMGFVFANEKEGGRALVVPMIWRNNTEKHQLLMMIRALFVAYRIESYVHISEAWGCDEKHYDPDIRNVDNPHRIEVLMCVGVNHTLRIGTQKEIDVDADGDRILKPMRHFAGKENPPEFFETGGLLSDLLPPKDFEISDEAREDLKSILPFELKPLHQVFANS